MRGIACGPDDQGRIDRIAATEEDLPCFGAFDLGAEAHFDAFLLELL